ncbi:30S ribosome-binding factor RbfA [Corynebacterium tuscaniense]|uniref:Ribosome-binding factor A n=1 Tax=Corynebacterium tuscaniense TaxID=302449 RepID=A0A2N6T3Z4_9CORY|nr:30S ribosome-binding factor RbfA [Corynebacterium tuscaniense]KAA8741012.1 30S ribosome-binding factor RbfA [Corynebacterium tuscaniense]KGF25123.1 ribosome-binding factor A [Corynebacterium tuscaniense DNF00037]PMC64012.1 30S ribosome-binding factor RbfA [Corynebacterium tuscaniense]
MADNTRAQRLAKRIQTIVASAIERQIKDRRLELVTVTDVRVTGDLHDATVFYTVRGANIDDAPDYEQAAEALHRARGQLRKIVGDELGVRFTPTLAFELDTVPEASARMEELLARARARDEELAELKKNATPAGEADPYKTKDE